jgi:hypothetical protein
MRSTPYGQPNPHGNVPSLFHDALSRQIAFGWINAIRTGLELIYPYYFCSILAVGSGLSSPSSWPPYYGSFAKAYTLRNMWGYCWHQNCRRIFLTPTNALIKALGIRKGGFASRYIHLYGSFIISALVHHIGSLNATYIPGVRNQFLFFMMQPVAITVEDGMKALGKRLGVRKSGKCSGALVRWRLC